VGVPALLVLSAALALLVLLAFGKHRIADGDPGYFQSQDQVLSVELSHPDVEDTQQNVIQQEEQIPTQWNRSDEHRPRRNVTLVIAVPSVRPERREAIRATWLNWADDRVALRFFVEPPNKDDENHQNISALLVEEARAHGDIVVQDIGTGMNFGVKLLEAMRWMSAHFSFDFFLRMDDDYFLCLERLLKELSCLLESGTEQLPFYAGSLTCRHNMSFMDEAYILMSSVVIGRILAASDLKCTGFGSYTAAAWMRIGGAGNPEGDVAWARDRRLDLRGSWWGRNLRGEDICQHQMGVHKTYPDKMKEQWADISSKDNVSQSIPSDGCADIFHYEDEWPCKDPSRDIDDEFVRARLAGDNVQPCDSFKPDSSKMWCGSQGC